MFHLFNPLSQPKKWLDYGYFFKTTILAFKFEKLDGLSLLRKMAEKADRQEIVWILGLAWDG